MSGPLEYYFDDLPLEIRGSFEAGLVSGGADIAYTRDGEWSIEAIYLDGFRERSAAERMTMQANGLKPSFYERKPVVLDAGTPIYLTIYHRLEHEWRESVQDAVRDAIAADRETEADDYADYRRDRLQEAV